MRACMVVYVRVRLGVYPCILCLCLCMYVCMYVCACMCACQRVCLRKTQSGKLLGEESESRKEEGKEEV